MTTDVAQVASVLRVMMRVTGSPFFTRMSRGSKPFSVTTISTRLEMGPSAAAPHPADVEASRKTATMSWIVRSTRAGRTWMSMPGLYHELRVTRIARSELVGRLLNDVEIGRLL